jgi:hypothetical protein
MSSGKLAGASHSDALLSVRAFNDQVGLLQNRLNQVLAIDVPEAPIRAAMHPAFFHRGDVGRTGAGISLGPATEGTQGSGSHRTACEMPAS